MPHPSLSRRALLAGTAGALGLAAAGCGRGRDDADPGASAGRGGYPLTVEHRFGATEIPAEPQRIVTVGLTDVDAVLALGAGPRLVGVTDFYEEFAYGVWPWAQGSLGGATPEVIPRPEGDRPDLELIAALEPDLIVGLSSALTQEDHDALSVLAPTVAQLGGFPDRGAPWDEMTLAIGRALNREEEAAGLVAGVKGRFAGVSASHPQFQGASAVVAERLDGTFLVLSPADPRSRFLEALGFEVPAEVTEPAGDSGAAPLAEEDLGLLDRDLLVWNAGFSPGLREELADHRVYQSLDAVAQGRALIVDDVVVSGALAWSTVLSLPFALERLVPRIAAAVDGDPDTPA
ncbi:ABC transporter substrate-binding protein [Nocardiopsis sp. CC223A]|uniref:ABC transporter substrate-binding protein n=1 Tax=Nocardiopsis sp. CC223A TaxID=3044051 RepID=UPI00278BE29B|nr:ABC transporter substrate-binding protein [Nocardiopsis sp. CC223A]